MSNIILDGTDGATGGEGATGRAGANGFNGAMANCNPWDDDCAGLGGHGGSIDFEVDVLGDGLVLSARGGAGGKGGRGGAGGNGGSGGAGDDCEWGRMAARRTLPLRAFAVVARVGSQVLALNPQLSVWRACRRSSRRWRSSS